jgi:hypothetical protein
MDVDLTIRYSDERLCEIVACRPDSAAPLYRIVSRRADLGASLTETLAELYAGGSNASGDLVNACAWSLLATKNSRGIHRHQARSEYERISTRLTPAQITKARLVLCRSARPGLRAFGGSPIRRSSRSFLAGRKCCRRRAPKRGFASDTAVDEVIQAFIEDDLAMQKQLV